MRDAWKAFGPQAEPILAERARITDAICTAIAVLLERGMRPVSVNSYLTCIRAYFGWLHREGALKERPRVELLRHEQR